MRCSRRPTVAAQWTSCQCLAQCCASRIPARDGEQAKLHDAGRAQSRLVGEKSDGSFGGEENQPVDCGDAKSSVGIKPLHGERPRHEPNNAGVLPEVDNAARDDCE